MILYCTVQPFSPPDGIAIIATSLTKRYLEGSRITLSISFSFMLDVLTVIINQLQGGGGSFFTVAVGCARPAALRHHEQWHGVAS